MKFFCHRLAKSAYPLVDGGMGSGNKRPRRSNRKSADFIKFFLKNLK